MSEQTKIKSDNNETLKAGCVVVNDKHEVLLVTDTEKKTWTFPKGHMEASETVEEAAVRETKEETGYDIQIKSRLSDVVYHHGKTGEAIRVAMFLATPLGITIAPEDHIISAWISVEEARRILVGNLTFLLDEIRSLQ